jgi:hypothetical protein
MLKWLHEQFLLSGFFIMLIMFSVNMLYTKVVDNFHVLLVLKFHHFTFCTDLIDDAFWPC